MSVTTAGMGRRGGVPRHRMLIAILAVSVALNLCVIAGAAWNRLHPPPALPAAGERSHKLEASLGLNDQQRAAFEAYVAAARTRTAELRQAIEPQLDAAWAELGKGQPDEAAILQRFNDASARWRTSQRETVEATMSLLATLTPEQRGKFVAAERDFRATTRRRHAEEAR